MGPAGPEDDEDEYPGEDAVEIIESLHSHLIFGLAMLERLKESTGRKVQTPWTPLETFRKSGKKFDPRGLELL